jgi:hypothetical protein
LCIVFPPLFACLPILSAWARPLLGSTHHAATVLAWLHLSPGPFFSSMIRDSLDGGKGRVEASVLVSSYLARV